MGAVERFLAGVEAGRLDANVFAADVVLDATVPNWRFTARGRDRVFAELSGWYADPGHFEDVRRTALPDGELVEFTLHWQEDGVQHTCHQAHIVRTRGDVITADTAFCGGRWPAPLVAEMQAAATS